MAITPEQLADALRPHLSDVDAAALTGELASYILESIQTGLRPGEEGWVEDDLAFTSPWGFDLSSIAVPALIWQGEHDLMVPPAHGPWLRSHVPGAEGEVVAGEGHLTLFANRIGDVHTWLRDRLGATG
jgi:pimeloyl-ACP methyl ester carboxylesterase